MILVIVAQYPQIRGRNMQPTLSFRILDLVVYILMRICACRFCIAKLFLIYIIRSLCLLAWVSRSALIFVLFVIPHFVFNWFRLACGVFRGIVLFILTSVVLFVGSLVDWFVGWLVVQFVRLLFLAFACRNLVHHHEFVCLSCPFVFALSFRWIGPG